jgi:hypothetical protein
MNPKSFMARLLLTVSISSSLIMLPPSFEKGMIAQAQLSLPVAPASWFEQIPAATPTARYSHAMAFDSRRNVVVLFGGIAGIGPSDQTNDTYELVDGVWVKRAPLHSPPSWFGGQSLAYDSVRGETFLCGSWVWDGTDWTERQSNNPPGCGIMAFDSKRGRMVMVLSGSGSSETWESDGVNWTQMSPVNNPTASINDGIAYDSTRGVIVLISRTSTTETWEWDGIDWTLRSTAGPSPRFLPSVVYDTVAERVVLYGGQGGPLGYFDDTWEWDGATGTWSQRNSFTTPSRRIAAMTFDGARGVSVLFGGDGPAGLLDDTWEWNSLTGTWTNSIPSTSPPTGQVAYDSNKQEIVLAGRGIRTETPMLQTWVYGVDGLWQRRYPSQNPSASAFGLTYDSIRKVIVLFGVENSGTAHTWEWDGMEWTERFPITSPSGREGFAIAYDPVRGVTVLFGGRWCYGTACNDTWIWDGVNWAKLSPAHNPPSRFHVSMTFDSMRGVMVLFGGGAFCPGVVVCYLNDTWEWDGSDWTLRTSALAPAPRENYGLAFDAGRGVTVLSNGWDLHTFDTWEWNGNDWTNITLTTEPPIRTPGQGMIYDDARRTVVLFGGANGGTWEYRSTNLPPTVSAGGPYAVREGNSIHVIASGTDPEGEPLSYAWDLDHNGSYETPGQDVIFSAVGLSVPSTHTIAVQVIDPGGLWATAETIATVVYNFDGFFQPVDNFPSWNELKAGRAVSLSFSLNGYKGLNIFEAGYPKSQEIVCDPTVHVDGIEETVTAGASGLSYDDSTDQYSYVWKTDKAWITNPCRQLVIKFKDGTFQRANFKFIK